MDEQKNTSSSSLKPEETDNQHFESDTSRIVRRHLENRDDEITEEDIRNVQVGMTPPPGQPESSETGEQPGSRESETGKKPGDQRITPWDLIDPDL